MQHALLIAVQLRLFKGDRKLYSPHFECQSTICTFCVAVVYVLHLCFFVLLGYNLHELLGVKLLEC